MTVRSVTTVSESVEDALAAWEVMCPGAVNGRIDPSQYRFRSSVKTFEGGGTIAYSLTGATAVNAQLHNELTVADFAGADLHGTVGRDGLPLDGPFLCPFEPIDMSWRSVSVRGSTIDMAVATEYLRSVAADDAVVVEMSDYRPRTPALRDYWRATFRGAHALLAELDGQDAPLIEAEIRRSLLVATLLAFPTNLGTAPGRGESRMAPLVARAKSYMDSHAHEPLTMPGVARHLGCSLRTLQEAFARDDLGAPSVYLRTVRLNNARAALRAAQPGTATVAQTARAWGYASPSRFTMHYTREFGRTPRDDLRR